MIEYATPVELARHLDPDAANPTPPPLATVLIRRASALVLDAISSARYTADTAGLPTNASIRDAVREATLEQAAAWSLHGIDPRKGAAGLQPIVTTKSLGGASVGYGQAAGVQDAIEALAAGDRLVSEAYRILSNAGLISNRVTVLGPAWGRDYRLPERSPFVIGTGTVGP